MILPVKPEGMLFRKLVPTPDHVRGKLFGDHALKPRLAMISADPDGTTRPDFVFGRLPRRHSTGASLAQPLTASGKRRSTPPSAEGRTLILVCGAM
jgi:hypothetical protein